MVLHAARMISFSNFDVKWLSQGGYLEAAGREFALAANSANPPLEVTGDYVGVLLDEARPKEALAVLSRVGEQERNTALFHCLSGQCSERLLQFGKATEEYNKAISIDPAQEKYYVFLASLLFYQKALSEAKQVLETALRRFPSSAPLIVAMGLVEVEDGNVKEAMEDYQTRASGTRGSIPEVLWNQPRLIAANCTPSAKEPMFCPQAMKGICH